MSDPAPSPDFFPPAPTPAPVPSPVSSVPPPAPVPPAPSQVRAGSFVAAGSPVQESPWDTAGTGSFTPSGTSGRRGVGTKLLFVALAIAGLIAGGIVTGHITFLTTGSSAPSEPAVPHSLGQASDGRFEGSGITFRYPAHWHAVSGVQFSERHGSGQSQMVFAPTTKDQFVDAVIVDTYALPQPVTDANVSEFRVGVGQLVDEFTRNGGGSVVAPLSDGRLGNLPAFLATVSLRLPGGAVQRVRLFVGYRGSTEYFVNCQSTAAGRAGIDKGCSQILRTFHVSRESS